MSLNFKHLCCHAVLLAAPFTNLAMAQEAAPAEPGSKAQEESKAGTVGGFFQSLTGTLNGAIKKVNGAGKAQEPATGATADGAATASGIYNGAKA